jgi:hypothetical protein
MHNMHPQQSTEQSRIGAPLRSRMYRSFFVTRHRYSANHRFRIGGYLFHHRSNSMKLFLASHEGGLCDARNDRDSPAGQPDSHARFWTHRWILAAHADSYRKSVGRGFYDVGARNGRHDKAGERSAVEWSKLHPAADIDAGSQPDQRSAELSRRQWLGGLAVGTFTFPAVNGQRNRSHRGMEMWKMLRVSHIPTPPATTTDKCPTRRYTNIPLGTKDRSGH